MRYEKECLELAELAKKQLNLEKNRDKGRFEDLSISEIYDLITDEICEVHEELYYDYGFSELRDSFNYERIIEELSDVAACLAGLLAKINKMKESK